MLSQLVLFSTLAILSSVSAEGTHLERNNLAYRSPYINHDSLAVDTRAIVARHDETARSIKRKRQLPPQVVAPKDKANTYTHSGYGVGVVDWSDASYIYSGDLNFSEPAIHSIDPGTLTEANTNEWLW